MTEQDLLILKNFASLWERVQNGGAAPLSARDPREEILERLYVLHGAYGEMAQQARGKLRCELLSMEKETDQMIRHLQAGLFLDAGDAFIPIKRRTFCKMTASNLQKLWKITTEIVALCESSDGMQSSDAAADLAAASEFAQRQKAALRAVFEQLL